MLDGKEENVFPKKKRKKKIPQSNNSLFLLDFSLTKTVYSTGIGILREEIPMNDENTAANSPIFSLGCSLFEQGAYAQSHLIFKKFLGQTPVKLYVRQQARHTQRHKSAEKQPARPNNQPLLRKRIRHQRNFGRRRKHTLLHYACGSRHNFGEGESSIKFLAAEEAIRQGADIDAKNYLGQTPLMQACTQAYKIAEPILQALLDEGAETDSKDGSGNTALHFAARNKINSDAFAIAEMLFDNANPDVSAVNSDGKTALDYATEANNTSLVKLLLSNM